MGEKLPLCKAPLTNWYSNQKGRTTYKLLQLFPLQQGWLFHTYMMSRSQTAWQQIDSIISIFFFYFLHSAEKFTGFWSHYSLVSHHVCFAGIEIMWYNFFSCSFSVLWLTVSVEKADIIHVVLDWDAIILVLPNLQIWEKTVYSSIQYSSSKWKHSQKYIHKTYEYMSALSQGFGVLSNETLTCSQEESGIKLLILRFTLPTELLLPP